MNEIIAALNQLEKEKEISKEVLMEAIENSLVAACKRDFGKADNVKVHMDRESGDISVLAEKVVVEIVEDPVVEMSLADARMRDVKLQIGDVVNVVITPKDFGRIAAQHARSVIVQKIKEEERKVLFNHFYCREKDIVTGVVQRYIGNNISISLDDKTDAVLSENEQVPGENFHPGERIKLYIMEVKDTNKGPKILVSRTHPELVKRLFEKEVAEVQDGTVEIKSISREAGSRTKIAVWSNDDNVDPVGSCVGLNGTRVNAIVNDLKGEKIDIINWSDNPAVLIENALSPSKVVSVRVNEGEKSAKVVVPDYQLSLAIGKEGQNARLAARLTGYKIDIKSESQAQTLFDQDEDDKMDSRTRFASRVIADDYEDDFDEDYSEENDPNYEEDYSEENDQNYEEDYHEENDQNYEEDYSEENDQDFDENYNEENGSFEEDHYDEENDQDDEGGYDEEYDEDSDRN